MSPRTVFKHATGILLAGTHPWTNSAFDTLAARTLLPVAHRPLIWYGLSWLHQHGVRDVAVCGNRETRALQSKLSRHVPFGMKVTYYADAMPRGAAGSARDAALATDADTFVIAEGTAIPNVDLTDVLDKHYASGACVTVVVHCETRSSSSAPLQVPSGIYVFSRRAFDGVPAQGFCDIKEKLIPQLYSAGERIVPYDAPAATPRVLDSSTYMAVNEWMIERLTMNSETHKSYNKAGQALIHPEAFVAADAALVGPVLVGPGARIESGAVVVGPASIGREAVVESGATVSRSAIWRRSTIGENAMVDQCIIADDGVVEAGAHACLRVVVADRAIETEVDWVAQQPVHFPKRPTLDVGARLGRLVFGPSWSRSPAAQ
jgi:NDP-sugar pyrophosphorylase family protein